ncbi:hypothetical protein SAMN05880582_101966 [Rhizobium sp. RU20A]|uniref:hypothetical protein n=1 Tax=Rhizobium sp. RU20A TaxID=1907412 RepID=UPI0009567B61|nr:hypothetical protein [Rhizobium sp. RU20A]SIQ16395.1 hypothetical protein SAMN05880582_101966 [Rhizobium sp. RU20A]
MNSAAISFPDRESLADKLQAFGETDQSYVHLIMENPLQDDNLLEGLHFHLDRQATAPFLNSMKLDRLGHWFGDNAPARLQIRLSEVARSSQHPAYQAFKAGLTRSGGLERAYPKA